MLSFRELIRAGTGRCSKEHFEEGYEAILAAVRSGRIEEAVVDEALTRIPALKLKKGLFENLYADSKKLIFKAGVKHCNGVSL